MYLLKRSSGLFFSRFSTSYALKSSNLLPNLINQRYISTKQIKNEESDNEADSEVTKEKNDFIWESLSDFEKDIFLKRTMDNAIDSLQLPNVTVEDFNSFLNALGESKKYKSLRRTFESMKSQVEPNEESYKILFKHLGSADNKDLDNLINIFETLKKQFSYQPTVKDYEILLLSFINNPPNFQKYYEEFEQSGLHKSSRLYNILIFFYGRRNNQQKVEEIFEEVKNSEIVPLNTSIYNSVIRFYGETGKWEKVDELYATLKKGIRGVKPNIKTFNTLLLVYGQHEKAEDLKRTVEELLSQKAVVPTKETEALYIRYREVLGPLAKGKNLNVDKQ